MSTAAKQEIVTIAPAQNVALTPMDMLNQAVERGANIDVLEKLMGLNERWERNQARKSFDAAIAAAKAEIPVIARNRDVNFGVGKTSYRFEDLAQIARTIDPVLTRHGLSYRFRTATEDGKVSVTCIISHRDGHSEENSISGAPDNSDSKNSIQAIGSTITYLQRYTLKAALGLASSNDADAVAAETGELLSPAQIDEMRGLIVETGANLPAFLKWAKVTRIEEIKAEFFASCMTAIRRAAQ